MSGKRLRSPAVLLTTVIVLAGSGCSTLSQAPCLQYSSQSFTRTVSLRGYGAVQVTNEALVCMRRADSANEVL